jgi:hypothetical protein
MDLPMLLPLLLLIQATPPSPEVRVVGPGRANAQTAATLMAEPAAMFVVACDADHDGRTTRAELDACIAASFAAMPTPQPGRLGYLAYADWQKRWLGDQGALPSPLEVDRSGDDAITLDELQAQFGRVFSRLDKDKDGAVTRAEALTIRATAFDGRGPAERGRGKPASRPRPERVPGGQPDAEEPGRP